MTSDLAAAFFGEHGVLGKARMQPLLDQRFDGMIGGADEILRAFGLGDELELATEIAPRQRPRFARERLHEADALGEIEATRGHLPAAPAARARFYPGAIRH